LWSSANHKATFSGQPIAVEDGDVMTIKPNWSQLDGTPGSASVVKRNGARSELRLK
jgi:hypothetical protein